MQLEEFKKKLQSKKEQLIITIEDPNSLKKIKYSISNDTTYWRARTLFTKEPLTIDWLRSFEKNSIFYDIGANVGMYTIFAACICDANVYAFEPEANNFQVLMENIVANNLINKINSFPVGISNLSSFTTLHLNSFVKGGSHHTVGDSLLDHNLNNRVSKYKQGIFSTSLDELINTWKLPIPNYLKIDVDGIEYKIIEKSDFLLKNKDLYSILIELNFNRIEDKKIISKLESFDFVYNQKQVEESNKFIIDQLPKEKLQTHKGYAEFIFYRK